jgi:hypothetical protein
VDQYQMSSNGCWEIQARHGNSTRQQHGAQGPTPSVHTVFRWTCLLAADWYVDSVSLTCGVDSTVVTTARGGHIRAGSCRCSPGVT